jgi:hypothetical protein
MEKTESQFFIEHNSPGITKRWDEIGFYEANVLGDNYLDEVVAASNFSKPLSNECTVDLAA